MISFVKPSLISPPHFSHLSWRLTVVQSMQKSKYFSIILWFSYRNLKGKEILIHHLVASKVVLSLLRIL